MASAQPPPDMDDQQYCAVLMNELAHTTDVFKIEKAIKPLESENILTAEEYAKVVDIINGPDKKPVRKHLLTKIDEDPELKGMYSLDKALALWIYTLEDPPVYKRVSSVMNGSKASRLSSAGELTAAVKACLVYVKFLDRALASLGKGFLVYQFLWRGMPFKNWENGAKVKFLPGHTFHWFEMKSTSTDKSVAADIFGGSSGTIFRLEPLEAYNIKPFSAKPSEDEVVLRPLSRFRVDDNSPHHDRDDTPVEIYLNQELSMRYVVMYGNLGAGKTTCFQTATDSFSKGKVSGDGDYVIGYNESQTRNGKFTVKDVPGTGAVAEVDKHVELQLRALRVPNHALIRCIAADVRHDNVASEILQTLEIFKYKPGIAFIITKCDLIGAYKKDPEGWKQKLLGKTRGHVKSTQLLLTSNMDPDVAGVDEKKPDKVVEWQQDLVARWQDKLCDFIMTNAQTRPEIYVELDLSDGARDQLSKYINATCGRGSWAKALIDLTEKLKSQLDDTLETIKTLGDRPSDEEQLYEWGAKVLSCASHFSTFVAAMKEEAARHTREHTCNAAVICMLNACWTETFEAERKVREACYEKLPYNPDDDTDNNKFRKCPICRTIWMKVNGCNGTMTCGEREFAKDNQLSLGECSSMLFPLTRAVRDLSHCVKGWYSKSVPEDDQKHTRNLKQSQASGLISMFSATENGVGVGCGAQFHWGTQPRLPVEMVKGFLVTVDNEHNSSEMVQTIQEAVIERYDAAISRIKSDDAASPAHEGDAAT